MKPSKVPSTSTPGEEFSSIMSMVERILLTTHYLKPYFWSKKKCLDFDRVVYAKVGRLTKIFMNTVKNYSEGILKKAFEKLTQKQLKKISELSAGEYNVGKLIQGWKFYCQNEIDIEAKASKQIKAVKPAAITVISNDCRNNKTISDKKSMWKFLKG